ncbi:unnamed protein product, partial [Rotaria sordida]
RRSNDIDIENVVISLCY